MRDIIKLFTDCDSRDELGLGQVRDVISDGLFPGTTVLLTRARYLLFVPWCFQLAEGKPDPLALSDKNERQVISTLRKSGSHDLTGLLGARVGQALQILPSTIYWGTLRRYGIVREEYAWKSDVSGPCRVPWTATTRAPANGSRHGRTRFLRYRRSSRTASTTRSPCRETKRDGYASACWSTPPARSWRT